MSTVAYLTDKAGVPEVTALRMRSCLLDLQSLWTGVPAHLLLYGMVNLMDTLVNYI